MKYILKRKYSLPCLHIKENIITHINNEFEVLTGFSYEELIGLSIKNIGKVLKLDSQVKLEEIDNDHSYYIFSKENEPREVKISYKMSEHENERIYYFSERKNSRVEDRYPYLSSVLPDYDIAFAVYSAPDGILLKANKKYVSYLENLCNNDTNKIGKTLNEFIQGYKDSKYEKHFTTVIRKGIPIYFKDHNDYNYENGNKYWDGSLVPTYIKGEIKYIIHIGIDVTERVVSRKIIEKQKEELEEQKQELEAIIENMSDEVIIFDKDGKFLKLNKVVRDNSICEFNKTLSISDFSDLGVLYDMDGNLISLENTSTSRVIKGEKINNVKIIRKNDKVIQIREVNGTPIYDSEGNFKMGVLISRDISERMKQEESIFIKTQYDTLYKIIKNLDLGITRVTYPEFKIIDNNYKAFSMMKKVKPNFEFNYLNQNINDILEINLNIKDITYNNNISSYYIISKYNYEGEEVFYKYIFQPLYSLNNDILEVIVVSIDITEDEKSKNKMEEAIKIQDELYMNVSHELRTPLTVIFSANQLMDMLLKSNLEENKEKLASYNNIVRQNCYRLTKLINNIIDLSKSNAGFLKIYLTNENIVNIVRNIVQSVSVHVTAKKMRITFETNVEEKIIACDTYMIERVLLNLISNAIKFSEPDSDIFINFISKNNTVEISVKDEGIGMDKKTLECLFQKYYQADKSLSRMAEGSGIGLNLIKTIVELHGGIIKVESKLGEGSIFKVELPANIVDNKTQKRELNKENKVEMIKIELSDIYSDY